jgi:phosphoribosylformylglycinamidine synthase subunit PurS
MTKAKVYVTLKPSVLDPQGKAVMNILHSLGNDTIRDVRVSKFIEINFEDDDHNRIKADLEKICDKVLANPNTETYYYEIEGGQGDNDKI